MKNNSFILFFLISLSVFGQQSGKNFVNENNQLKITSAERQEFAAYLNKKWNIIKLLNNPCDDEKIINISDDFCLNRKGLSYGSHYSFSARVYYQKFLHVRYATLSFIKDKMVVKNSDQTIQILTDLGDRQIPDQELSVKIKDFANAPLNNEIQKNLRDSNYQFDFDKMVITNNLVPATDHQYLIRSFFMDYYQTLIPHPRETIYYFKIVRKSENVMIILWREIYSKNI